METDQKGIGLLGGSFDPVHNAHLSIAKSFLDSGYLSELWVLLTPDPPHKPTASLADYEERLKMLNAAFDGEKHISVSDVERRLPSPSYTVQTLKYLTEKYPDQQFYLCIGQDSLADFKQWKNWEQILEYCQLLVARRPDNDTKSLDPGLASNLYFVDHQPIAVSSTQIREAVANGQDVSEFVPEEVARIIKQSNLYQK